ncbi:TAXI family TRAP transporter solute-binding subunit [Methylobacterium sp. A54F]
MQGEYAYDALSAQDGREPTLTVVALVDTLPGLVVVPSTSPVRSVEDLLGKAVALGTRASGLTVIGRTVLQGSGIDPDDDIAPVLLDHAGVGAGLVLDGTVAALWGGGCDWPSFKALAESPGGARFFGPAPRNIGQILTLRASLRRLTIPPGSFKGQDEPIETVGSWSFILARPGLPDAIVFWFMQAIGAGTPLRGATSRDARATRASIPRPCRWLVFIRPQRPI